MNVALCWFTGMVLIAGLIFGFYGMFLAKSAGLLSYQVPGIFVGTGVVDFIGMLIMMLWFFVNFTLQFSIIFASNIKPEGVMLFLVILLITWIVFCLPFDMARELMFLNAFITAAWLFIIGIIVVQIIHIAWIFMTE